MMTSALLRVKTWCIAYEYEVAHHVLHAAVLCSSCTYYYSVYMCVLYRYIMFRRMVVVVVMTE